MRVIKKTCVCLFPSLPAGCMRGAATVVALLLLGLSGCGIKAPPVAPREKSPPVVKSLTHTLENNRVTLIWHLAEGSPTVESYTVYRFEMKAEKVCKGCPRTFKRIARIPASSQTGGSETIVLKKGVTSVFKITAAATGGREGPASGAVSVTYE